MAFEIIKLTYLLTYLLIIKRLYCSAACNILSRVHTYDTAIESYESRTRTYGTAIVSLSDFGSRLNTVVPDSCFSIL